MKKVSKAAIGCAVFGFVASPLMAIGSASAATYSNNFVVRGGLTVDGAPLATTVVEKATTSDAWTALQANSNASDFVALVNGANLASSYQNFTGTVLVPDNQAFDIADPVQIAALNDSPKKVAALIASLQSSTRISGQDVLRAVPGVVVPSVVTNPITCSVATYDVFGNYIAPVCQGGDTTTQTLTPAVTDLIDTAGVDHPIVAETVQGDEGNGVYVTIDGAEVHSMQHAATSEIDMIDTVFLGA